MIESFFTKDSELIREAVLELIRYLQSLNHHDSLDELNQIYELCDELDRDDAFYKIIKQNILQDNKTSKFIIISSSKEISNKILDYLNKDENFKRFFNPLIYKPNNTEST